MRRVVKKHELQGWQPYLKQGDRLWLCPQGWYFFDFFKPEVGDVILDF